LNLQIRNLPNTKSTIVNESPTIDLPRLSQSDAEIITA
jgi:hypothetical protein